MENDSKEFGKFSSLLLQLSKECDQGFSALKLSEPINIRQYEKDLRKAIREVHNGRVWQRLVTTCTRKRKMPFDCCHFEYHSLVQFMYSGGENKRNHKDGNRDYTRFIFSPNLARRENTGRPIHQLFQQFSNAVQSYEHGHEMLPAIVANVCSVGFFPRDLEKEVDDYINDGIYPLDKNAISMLCEMLLRYKLSPAEIDPGHFEELFELEFSPLQEKTFSLWEKARDENEWGKFVPTSQGVFRFALYASLNTLQLVSEELFRQNLKKEPNAEKVRASLLKALKVDDGRLPRRALSFVPIRIIPGKPERWAHKVLEEYETVGLAVFYSADPIPANRLLPIALAERLLFSSLRQREFYITQEALRNYTARLQGRSVYAKRLAHCIKTPFQDIEEFAVKAKNSLKQAEQALESFVNGNFERMMEPCEVEINDVLMTVEGPVSARIDNRKINYENQVVRKVCAYTDPEDLRFILEVLIDNASKYADSYIKVCSEVKEEKGKKYTHISIENDGPLIPNRVRKALFEPPIDVRRNGVMYGNGFGIGLYLARFYARRNNGDLTYEVSPSNKYNKFVLKLPKNGPAQYCY